MLLNNETNIARHQDRKEEAERQHLRAGDWSGRRRGRERHPFVADDVQALARTQKTLGDFESATASMEESDSICEERPGEHRLQCAWKTAILGELAASKGPGRARTLLEARLADLKKAHGKEHSRTKAVVGWLARLEPTDSRTSE